MANNNLNNQTDALLSNINKYGENINKYGKNTANILNVIRKSANININDNFINFIDETAKVESGIYENPLSAINLDTGAAGKYQFIERRFRDEKGNEIINNSVTTALNRLSAVKLDGSGEYVYFKGKLPSWIKEAKKNIGDDGLNKTDITKLDDDKQTALFLANLHQQDGTNELFRTISEGKNEEIRNKAKLEIYMRNHYKGKKYAANVAIHAGEIFFNDLNFKDKVNHWREYMYNEME